jgi:hypothetical protein
VELGEHGYFSGVDADDVPLLGGGEGGVCSLSSKIVLLNSLSQGWSPSSFAAEDYSAGVAAYEAVA